MGKRRIYEIAKELNIDSKELVIKLQAIGIEVKSHSSTVDEDDLKRALAKPADKKPEVRRPGMVVRKKADIPVPVVEPVEEPEQYAAEPEPMPEPEVERYVPEHRVPDVVESQPVEVMAAEPEHRAAPRVEPEQPESSEVQQAVPTPSAPVERFEAAATRSPIEQPTAAHAARPGEVKPAGAAPITAGATPAVPGAPVVPGGIPQASGTNPGGGARVVRMIDRDKLISRIPPRRLPPSMGGPRPGTFTPGGFRPGGAPGGYRPGPGGPVRPGGLRPGPGSLEPQMNGPLRYGQVKEIRVVQDAYGKGKEMVDVAKERARKGPGGATTEEKRPRLDKRSLMQMHERSFQPSRLKRRRGLKRMAVSTTASTMKASKRVIHMGADTITPADLAADLSVKVSDVIRKLMELGVMATINHPIDFDTATLVAQAYNFTVESEAFDEDDYLEGDEEELAEGEVEEGILARPPVVTIMGHVDHGKTSLLDAIRNEDVASGEAGGITQHIGAYQVDTPKGKITFLDTPGHEAFTAMRARGAKVTDLVVLVVAADDGPMPQTIEAIRHAQAANVPIIVAVNKIDKPSAKPEQIMQALTEYKLVPEEWGGDVMYVKTSALKKTGINELLDAILLQSEVLELDANPTKTARGTVVEARLDKGFGPRVSMIVQDGTLRVGDAVVAGTFSGKVRSMLDDKGNQIKEALPSTPVEIMGLDGVPNAGDMVNAVEDLENAKTVAQHRAEQLRTDSLKAKQPKVTMEDIYAKLKGTPGGKEFKIVIKADVQGSVEALRESFLKLTTSEVALTIVHSAVGAVNEGDVLLASASGGVVICFNVKPDAKARNLAEQEGVEIKQYNIIYNALDDVRKAMGGMLTPTTKEQILGRALVRQIFGSGKAGVVAGCAVQDGKITRAARVRVLRNEKKVFEGKMSSLKRFKDDAREVEKGFECGIMLDGFTDVRVDDVIEAFEMTEVARTLGDTPPPARTTSPNRTSGAPAYPAN